MDILISILAFIFALGLIVCIHEGGHFFFARKFNVLCREFAFGMGPQLVKKKKGETTYSIRALPIGGFCAIAGEEEELDPLKKLKKVRLGIEDGVVKKFYVDEKNAHFNEIKAYELVSYDIYDEADTGNLFVEVKENEEDEETIIYPVDPAAMFVLAKEEIQMAPHNRTLNAKKKYQRALIMFGGPLMNFVLALIVFFIAGLIKGFTNTSSSVLGSVTEETPASIASLQAGDEITQFIVDGNTYTINNWTDLEEFMATYSKTNTYTSNTINCTYVRDGATYNSNINPELTSYALGGVGFYQNGEGKVICNFQYLSEESVKTYEEGFNKAAIHKAGLNLGDVIVKVDDTDINCLQDLYNVLMANAKGNKMKIYVEGRDEAITVSPYSQSILKASANLNEDPIPLAKITLGVSPTNKFNFFKSFAYSGKMTLKSSVAIINTLKLLFTGGIGLKNMGGFVAIFSYTANAAKSGFTTLLRWIGLLSVNIGIMNLLPIPALDGGRLVFVAYEAITRKKPNPKVETILITVTMILLFGLMIVVTFNDIMRLIRG